MRLVAVACVVAQFAVAQPVPGVVVGKGRCRLQGPLPTRTLVASDGWSSVAHVDPIVTVTAELDTRSAAPVIRTRVDHQGWHIDGYIAAQDAVAPVATMWFGKSVVIGAGTALRLRTTPEGAVVAPMFPWWLHNRLSFDESLRAKFDCGSLTLASRREIDESDNPEPFVRAQGLPWGPPAAIGPGDAGAGVELVDDEGHHLATLTPRADWLIPARLIERAGARAKVLLADEHFAVIGWVDSAAVTPGTERVPLKVEHLPPPKHTVCRAPKAMTVNFYNASGEGVVGTLDANAPFSTRPPPPFPEFGSRERPRDLATRLYISPVPVKILEGGEWWVTRPSEMSCVDE